MKIISFFLITIFFTTFLHAEYLRTIRLGSFESESRAQAELKNLKTFVNEHQTITELQKSWDFAFTYRKSGSYYVIIAEPLRDKNVLQNLIDTLRLAYPDAYVTRLKSAPPFKKTTQKKVKVVPLEKELEEKVLIPEELFETETLEVEVEVEVEKVEEKKVLEVEKTVEKLETKEEVTVDEVKTEREAFEYNFDEKEETIVKADESEVTDKNYQIYKISFYVTLFLLFVVSLLLLRYKRKSTHYKDKEIQTNQIFTKKDIEIKHKDSFLSHAKNSVATIHNFTNLLLEFDLTVIQKDYVQRIRSSSEHLLNTVNNTLDITKLKNQTLRIENSEFDLNEMLRKVEKIISLEAKNNDTKFKLSVEDDVPSFIFGDATRIRQVLINLLGNSVKFTKGGEISLTIKTLYKYTHAITLGFIVKDTGIGMSTQQVEDILHPSTEIVENGTVGLGLSVTKQLIELMNGEIKIYSTEDVGTTFTFTLKFKVKR